MEPANHQTFVDHPCLKRRQIQEGTLFRTYGRWPENEFIKWRATTVFPIGGCNLEKDRCANVLYILRIRSASTTNFAADARSMRHEKASKRALAVAFNATTACMTQ